MDFMALIPPIFLDSVIAIGSNDEKGELVWIGTGFLVGRLLETGNNDYAVFLVTNKHVIGDRESLILRFNPQSNEKSKDFPLKLIDDKNNVFVTGHPKESIDVAVIPMNIKFLKDQKMTARYFRSDIHVLTKKRMIESQLSEGDFIYTLGFPMNLVDIDRKYTIARSGVIARIKDYLDGFSNNFLVDSFVFPGNSGGPVINKPEISGIEGTKILKSSYLIGMVESYLPYQDIAISLQTKRIRTITEENSGLASVIPADFILETIKIAYSN
jgi:S1-C subfamily serine protease